MFSLMRFHYSRVLPQPAKAVGFNTKCLSSWEDGARPFTPPVSLSPGMVREQFLCCSQDKRFPTGSWTPHPAAVPVRSASMAIDAFLSTESVWTNCIWGLNPPSVYGPALPSQNLIQAQKGWKKESEISQMGGLPGCWTSTGKESTHRNFHLDLWGWACFLWAFSQAFSLFQGSVWSGSKQIHWNKHFHSSWYPPCLFPLSSWRVKQTGSHVSAWSFLFSLAEPQSMMWLVLFRFCFLPPVIYFLAYCHCQSKTSLFREK